MVIFLVKNSVKFSKQFKKTQCDAVTRVNNQQVIGRQTWLAIPIAIWFPTDPTLDQPHSLGLRHVFFLMKKTVSFTTE